MRLMEGRGQGGRERHASTEKRTASPKDGTSYGGEIPGGHLSFGLERVGW